MTVLVVSVASAMVTSIGVTLVRKMIADDRYVHGVSCVSNAERLRAMIRRHTSVPARVVWSRIQRTLRPLPKEIALASSAAAMP